MCGVFFFFINVLFILYYVFIQLIKRGSILDGDEVVFVGFIIYYC